MKMCNVDKVDQDFLHHPAHVVNKTYEFQNIEFIAIGNINQINFFGLNRNKLQRQDKLKVG